MEDVIVKIRISESEYKRWSDFEKGDKEGVREALYKDFVESCESLYIEHALVSVEFEKN